MGKCRTEADFWLWSHFFREGELCAESVRIYLYHQHDGTPVLHYDLYLCTAGIVLYLEEEKLPFDRFVVTAYDLSDSWNGKDGDVVPYGGQERNEASCAHSSLRKTGIFWFATHNNANIITELTNGEVEIGNIGDPEHLEYFKWSSP